MHNFQFHEKTFFYKGHGCPSAASLWTWWRKKSLMCPKHSWQREATQNLFFHMLLLHTPSKTEIIGGLGRVDITALSACPARRTVQPTAVHLGTAFLVLLFPLLQRRMSVFIRERLKLKMEGGFSNIDKQSLNALRNMNHVSDVSEAA